MLFKKKHSNNQHLYHKSKNNRILSLLKKKWSMRNQLSPLIPSMLSQLTSNPMKIKVKITTVNHPALVLLCSPPFKILTDTSSQIDPDNIFGWKSKSKEYQILFKDSKFICMKRIILIFIDSTCQISVDNKTERKSYGKSCKISSAWKI